MEWLADMGIVRKILVKSCSGQKWLYYQSCFDYRFLLSRTCAETAEYVCCGLMEKIRYRYAVIKEKINRATIHPSYNSPFVIAETVFAVPVSQKEKEQLKKKIEELD